MKEGRNESNGMTNESQVIRHSLPRHSMSYTKHTKRLKILLEASVDRFWAFVLRSGEEINHQILLNKLIYIYV